MLLRLIRNAPLPGGAEGPDLTKNAAVRGTLYLIDYDLLSEQEVPRRLCPTLENSAFIIPPGRYRLTVTHSPKFKRTLPLVCGVEGRSGIRFHAGSKPEHSRGCILLSRADEDQLTRLIQSEKLVLLEIRTANS